MEYYGKYRGIVEDVADPENRGRIRAKCPEVLGEQLSRWALPCFPPNTFTLPPKGALIWIEFEGGNRDKPIWTGMFYTKEQFAGKFGAPYSPDKYIIKSVGEFVEINSNRGITRVGNLKTLDVQVNGDLISTGNITDSDGTVHMP